MTRVFLFALIAALNPTLLTATTVMLLLPNQKRLMLGYLAGALTNGILLGVAIVEWLSGSGVVSTTRHTLAPGVDLALGMLALLAAYVLRSRPVGRRDHDKPKKTPRWREALSRGSARMTFVVGVLLSFPGASYLAGLTELSRQDLNTVWVVVAVLAMNATMLILLEVPLISFAVAPEWTAGATDRINGWLAENGARALVSVLTVLGVLFIVHGIATIVA